MKWRGKGNWRQGGERRKTRESRGGKREGRYRRGESEDIGERDGGARRERKE